MPMLWLEGRRLDGDCAVFDLRDRGLMLGDGLFDTSLAVNGRVVFADAHMDRLAGSCAVFGIPFDRWAAARTLTEAAAEIGTGALRITVTRGAAPRGLLPPADPAPRTIVAAHAGRPGAVWRPVRLASTGIRRNETSPTSRHKCLSYLDAIVALDAAAAGGADEVLFRNTAGRAVCCATGNLFVLTGKVLRTPPIADGVLPGVLRRIVMELCPDLGLTAREESLTPSDLSAADAVFMTNSLRLIAPVVSVDGVSLSADGFQTLQGLARALAALVEDRHGSCRWIAEGPAAWPISA
ncbi:MAG: aminotransferase class IV [Rhodobacteraceae bacterium]|nr:aminotransferase class IV [Paracoccaceae bacterium]